jgi:hypothetical protein
VSVYVCMSVYARIVCERRRKSASRVYIYMYIYIFIYIYIKPTTALYISYVCAHIYESVYILYTSLQCMCVCSMSVSSQGAHHVQQCRRQLQLYKYKQVRGCIGM